MTSVLAWSAAAVGIYVFAAWLLSVIHTRADIVDPFWGPGFVVLCGTVVLLNFETPLVVVSPRGLLLLLVGLWGMRLGVHLTIRWFGEEHEDRRYAAMRHAGGSHWWLQSLFTVFALQGFLMWLIGLPLQQALLSAAPVTWTLFAAGVVLWVIGFVFETVGDWQLTRFRSDPDNAARVLNSGLWRYTRHPNYFGDFTIWWGFFLMAVACGASWWTIFCPALMSVFLMKFSGVGMLEKDISSRRPGYAEYVRTTSTFWPRPPRPAASAAACSPAAPSSRSTPTE